MFFDEWNDLVRILVIGPIAYVALIIVLRSTGKRTLSKMNAFDFVVTVSLGSTLASTLLSQDVSLSEGITAFALLCVLQLVVTYASVRSARFQALVKAEPSLLFHRGQFLDRTLRRERFTPEEVVAAMRAHGASDVTDVEAVVLETDGSLSVITAGAGTTLRNVGRTQSERP